MIAGGVLIVVLAYINKYVIKEKRLLWYKNLAIENNEKSENKEK